MHAVGEEGDQAQLVRFAGSDDEFLVMCGVVGLGRLVAEGPRDQLVTLRALASDERWRIREAVAMALQRWGDADVDGMLTEVERWADGTPLEQRAAIVAACEPRLLREPEAARRTLALVHRVTVMLPRSRDRVLRQALGYCWSVAIAALPTRACVEASSSGDPDVRWVVRENLKKARLARLR